MIGRGLGVQHETYKQRGSDGMRARCRAWHTKPSCPLRLAAPCASSSSGRGSGRRRRSRNRRLCTVEKGVYGAKT
jgi:hypothetical protein